MENNFNEVKINVRSLLTSSPKPLSIEQLQRDYRASEGIHLPYRSLGFNSAIELLQNMKDVLVVPPNPNQFSLLSLVVGDKSSHLRNLIVKQKSNTKKKNRNSGMKGRFGNDTNHNGSSRVYRNNRNNRSYNSGSDYHRYNTSSPINNQRNQQDLSYDRKHSMSPHNDFNKKNSNQNGNHSSGYVTNELRFHIEKYITENQMLITANQLKELIINHSDFMAMKAESMQDALDKVKEFIEINETGVSLKKSSKFGTNVSVYQIEDTPNKSLNTSKYVSCNNSLPSISTVNNIRINNNNKTVNDSKQFGCVDDKQMISDIYTNLKISEQGSHSDNDEISDAQYLDICKNKCRMRKLEEVKTAFDKNKNSDATTRNLKNNIEFVKRQSAMRKNKNINTETLNGIHSDYSSHNQNGFNSLKQMTKSTFSHSTPKQSQCDIKYAKISSNDCSLNRIPIEVLSNISKIFQVYDGGLNIENYKLIYNKLYHTSFDPAAYGFESVIQIFKVLDQMIEIRNNVLYTKNGFAYSELYENIDHKNDSLLETQESIIQDISSNNKLKISLHLEQLLLPVSISTKTNMMLVEAYSPSLFYLQLAHKTVEFDRLMNLLQCFYDKENTNYCVPPEQILPGSVYVSSYNTFSNLKLWFRVRVLREVSSAAVEVIHVDYGTVDNIPKTELRFLQNRFCYLPCQAIHCCLTGYNEIDTYSLEVSEAFVKIIDTNKPVVVEVDYNYTLNEQCQILHVTLFQHDSKKLKNINNELTIWHLKH